MRIESPRTARHCPGQKGPKRGRPAEIVLGVGKRYQASASARRSTRIRQKARPPSGAASPGGSVFVVRSPSETGGTSKGRVPLGRRRFSFGWVPPHRVLTHGLLKEERRSTSFESFVSLLKRAWVRRTARKRENEKTAESRKKSVVLRKKKRREKDREPGPFEGGFVALPQREGSGQTRRSVRNLAFNRLSEWPQST